jgi:hypothetical protein
MRFSIYGATNISYSSDDNGDANLQLIFDKEGSLEIKRILFFGTHAFFVSPYLSFDPISSFDKLESGDFQENVMIKISKSNYIDNIENINANFQHFRCYISGVEMMVDCICYSFEVL